MNETSQALQKIARGAGITIVGTVISLVLGFASRALIARGMSVSDYGLFTLTTTIIALALTVATLGIPSSMPRQVPYYLHRKREEFPHLISTATFLMMLSGITLSLLLFLFSGFIAQLFTDTRISWTLKIATLASPFLLLTSYIISVTLGLGRVREKFYYQQLFKPLLWLIGIAALYIIGLNVERLIYLWVVLNVLIFLFLAIDVEKLNFLHLKPSFNTKIARELIVFSLPLMLSGILWTIMTMMDTLMVGHYLPSSEVGIYNAAIPLAKLLSFFLMAINTLYIPMATPLYARGKSKELKRLYQVVTKWIFLGTLPFFVVIFVFPETSLELIFGSKYLSAGLTLQILAIGFMIHALLGPNGLTLTVIGETKFLTFSNSLAVVTDLILNILFIPLWGIEGAALATVISYLIVNVANSIKLYKRVKIQPFNPAYSRSLVVETLLVSITKVFVTSRNIDCFTCAVILMFIFIGTYVFSLLTLRVIEKEDIELMLTVEKKFGINLEWAKKIVRKFI